MNNIAFVRETISSYAGNITEVRASERFANLRPITEFLDVRRISKPANFSEIQSRVSYNIAQYSSNYGVIFLLIALYTLLTNWLLLFVVALVVGGMFGERVPLVVVVIESN